MLIEHLSGTAGDTKMPWHDVQLLTKAHGVCRTPTTLTTSAASEEAHRPSELSGWGTVRRSESSRPPSVAKAHSVKAGRNVRADSAARYHTTTFTDLIICTVDNMGGVGHCAA